MYLAVAPVKFKADVRVEDEASQGDVRIYEVATAAAMQMMP